MTGQRWGNPLYLWERHQPDYTWWKERIEAALKLVDLVRIDHFRGFDRYWEIPASEPTAMHGRWLSGPGRKFFDALRPDQVERIIAEDLGDDLGGALTLRDDLHLPGMIVLQFAFGGSLSEQERFAPGKSGENFVVYTGTHDNNTMLGWWYNERTTQTARDRMLAATNRFSIGEPNWAMIRLGMDYPAHTFIVPLQDVLGLGESARMNMPSVTSGFWRWRCTTKDLEQANWARLWQYTRESGRLVANRLAGVQSA